MYNVHYMYTCNTPQCMSDQWSGGGTLLPLPARPSPFGRDPPPHTVTPTANCWSANYPTGWSTATLDRIATNRKKKTRNCRKLRKIHSGQGPVSLTIIPSEFQFFEQFVLLNDSNLAGANLSGRGPTGLRARLRDRGRLENRSHVVRKTGSQSGGDRTRIFTHKMIILAYFMTWYNNFLAWRQRIVSLVCFANNAISPWPQVMPIFDQEMSPGFTPAICLRRDFVYISILENRGDKSLYQNF